MLFNEVIRIQTKGLINYSVKKFSKMNRQTTHFFPGKDEAYPETPYNGLRCGETRAQRASINKESGVGKWMDS
jgi:hypothetical protein